MTIGVCPRLEKVLQANPNLERHGRTVSKTVEKIENFLDLIEM